MGKQLLFVLVAFLASLDLSIYATAEPRFLGELLAGLGGGSDRDDDLCEIKKPEDQCIEPGINNPPFCRNETCTFVPEYGEEVNSWDQIFAHEHDFLKLLFGYKREKGKYRKIIDAGESLTKSFEGVVCENEKTRCGCKDGTYSCDCTDKDEVKVCEQKYEYKYHYYFVYSNALFCERKTPSWLALLYKMLGGGASPRHFTSTDYSQNQHYRPPYNPYSQTPSSFSFFQYMHLLKKDKHEHLDLVYCTGDNGYNSYQPDFPFGLGIPQFPSPFPFGHNNHHSPYDYSNNHSPYDHNKPSYDKHHNPYGHSSKPNYHAPLYQQDYNTPIKRMLLKVKVPSGCDCEDYE